MIKFITKVITVIAIWGLDAKANGNDVAAFAQQLIQIVKRSNIEEFKQIKCIKIPCGDIASNIIFSKDSEQSNFIEIMSATDITFKIVGPYTVEEEFPNATFTIVFYSQSNNPFDSKGNINMEKGFNELYRSFLQTQVTLVDGKVYFQRVPFYLESHHPYVGDYG